MREISLEGGFADPVLDSQRVFRALMDALARPGTMLDLADGAQPPLPLSPELAAVALTLLDHDSPVWLDPELSASDAAVAWLRFHTGAPIATDPGAAAFALVASAAALPRLDAFFEGSQEYPDRSATVIVMLESLDSGPRWRLTGPGIKGASFLAPAGLADDFAGQWAENRQRFPRGIDLILLAPGKAAGLPRSASISTET